VTGYIESEGDSIFYRTTLLMMRLGYKYEQVYLSEDRDGRQAVDGLGRYFDFYNNRRPQQSLDYRTPSEVYFENRFSYLALPPSQATEEQVLCNATVFTL